MNFLFLEQLLDGENDRIRTASEATGRTRPSQAGDEILAGHVRPVASLAVLIRWWYLTRCRIEARHETSLVAAWASLCDARESLLKKQHKIHEITN